ncbi:neuronal acetylcholine receptor subunit alpha-5-like [Mizuhopecten yessoensis]|uniref:neuronal acetylcholine receptor subunit alpha-5-like n=1 Tax=Mizuhopecten yessoensis TaxID=6573 RepID=UPI000B4594A7|nr:neuronal acetylcholine receptor subunit alpha-5-like [Mizuhopecten yessoensis]
MPIISALRAFVCQDYSFDKENELRTLLFKNNSYNLFARPEPTVNVDVSLNIINFNDLNIRDQQLTTTGYFFMRWTDGRLFWDDLMPYNLDVPVIFTSEEYVWHPALIVENSISDISVISDSGSPILVDSKGSLTWRPSGIFATYCDVDIQLYPFDTQICSISLTSLAYSMKEVNLVFNPNPVDTEDLNENGEWIYNGYSTSRELVTRESLTYSVLIFNFVLKRRPLYHVLNTFIPTISLAFLTCMVFKLPADSGEKIGYALTIVLSYAVYLTLVADSTPSSSTTVSLLSIYLVTTLILGMLSVVLTIFVLDCHHADEVKPVPKLLQQFCRMNLISKWCAKIKHREKVSDSVDTIPTTEENVDISLTLDKLAGKEEVTWRDVARTLDCLFLWLYFFIVFVGTSALVITFAIAYHQ